MQTGAPSVWEYTKGRPSRRRVPGNSTHAGRARSPRPRGAVGSPASGARKSPRVSSRRTLGLLSPRRGPGKREAGSGGASAVGICSPLASQARVPARRKPTSCRCQNYTSRHPLRCQAESENKFWAARELPSAGSPTRSAPHRCPPARCRDERQRFCLLASLAPAVGSAGHAGLVSPEPASRARGAGFPRFTPVGTRKLVGKATPARVLSAAARPPGSDFSLPGFP